jgi:hypothetical protein
MMPTRCRSSCTSDGIEQFGTRTAAGEEPEETLSSSLALLLVRVQVGVRESSCSAEPEAVCTTSNGNMAANMNMPPPVGWCSEAAVAARPQPVAMHCMLAKVRQLHAMRAVLVQPQYTRQHAHAR